MTATLSVLVALDMLIGTLLVLAIGLTGAVPLDFGGAFAGARPRRRWCSSGS